MGWNVAEEQQASRCLAYLLTASIFDDQAPVNTGHPRDLWLSRMSPLSSTTAIQ
jgi:hypothetical protein